MFIRKKKKLAPGDAKAQPPSQTSQSPRLKASLLSLEPRLMFDAAAAATAAEVNTEQVAQEQAEAAVSGENAQDSQTQEGSDSHDFLQAISTFMPNESRTEVAFVDPTVPNYQEFLSGMDLNIEVVMLDGAQDGVEQMATALSGRTGIDAIHIISHGSAGELHLGTSTLNTETMSDRYANDLATIQHALSEQADVLVYGCDFAKGETGQIAVDMLAELTGADVDASNDLTGHISLDGDWDLEVKTGSIETHIAISDDVQMNWVGVLATATVKDTFSSKSYSSNNGTQSWSTSWSETDVGASDANGGHIKVNSGQLRIDAAAVGEAVSRGVNLTGASSATLSFDYSNDMSKGGSVDIRVSTDGGASYQTLSSGIFSKTSHTGSGTVTFDLSNYMSTNTKIQFLVTGSSGGDRLFVDNVQVSYNTGPTNSAPTIMTSGGGDSASITVAENVTTGMTVGAADVNTGQTVPSNIAGGADAEKFSSNSSTGQRSVASMPNEESSIDSGGDNVYDVRVQVPDGNGGTDTQAIAVTGMNVNEGPSVLTLGDSAVVEQAVPEAVLDMLAGSAPTGGEPEPTPVTNPVEELTAEPSSPIAVTNANEGPMALTLSGTCQTLAGSPEANTLIAVFGDGRPVALPMETANKTSEPEFRPPDDRLESIALRPEPSIIVEAIPPAQNLPHLAQEEVIEQAAVFGGKQNLPTSSAEGEGTAVNLGTMGSQDVAHLGSNNLTLQHPEEMERTSDESTGLDMSMAVGLAGVMLQGSTGLKEKMTAMSTRLRALYQRSPSNKKPGQSNEDEEGSVPQESGHDRKASDKSDPS
jgi:hypothetical protein